ncbi:MAG TPA: hypothetical protein VF232_05355, partial [Gaiellaceae bacterium]
MPSAAGAPNDVTIDIVITGTLGTNNWYTSNVTVNWVVTGADNSSGCDAKTLTTDTTGTTLTCTASDVDGTLTKSKTFKIDKTPPTATASAGRAADTNGWYNHALTVSFSGTDATAEIASCSSPVDYSGPNSANAVVNGSCTDNAGNVGTASLPFNYDDTPPTATASASRAADTNGWYNHPLTVSFSGSDATAGLNACSTPVGYSTDNASATVSGTCTDNAGNVTTASKPLKYDSTPPTATATGSRPADTNGWYNHPLTVNVTGSDTTAGIDVCSPTTYSGPDNNSATVSGSCTDNAGNVTTASKPLKYDSTPPTATATGSRPADTNGWYNH